MLWDKLQVLVDPHYRQSFLRAEQNARKQGTGFWWGPGEAAPSRMPGLQ
jgi:endonuclease YncB( thermonuclease family)